MVTCCACLSVVFQQLKCKYIFFTDAVSVYCRTLSCISFLLIFHNEFRDTFSNSPVPNKSTVSCLVNRLCEAGTLHQVPLDMKKGVNPCSRTSVAEIHGP
jgi:hypothetical protein